MINPDQKYNIFKKKNLTEEHLKFLNNLNILEWRETKNYLYREKEKYAINQSEGYFVIKRKECSTPYTLRRLKFKNIKTKEIIADIIGKEMIQK